MNDLIETTDFAKSILDTSEMYELLIRFVINTVVVGGLIHFFYYPKSQRKDYYFTFFIISVSVFLMIYLLGGVKLKIGFALGLFAIFGIIRYRTESMPVREMTYLFAIIAVSVINALAEIGYAGLLIVNVAFIICIWLTESAKWLNSESSKLIQYDRIALIKPECRQELIIDLKLRTGLNVTKVEVGSIDFLRDTAVLKVYYVSADSVPSTIEDALTFKDAKKL
ncbi:MAG: DUF4956 domain-containing protein [Bacteroidales bacterium]|nr:DUF4956 domain-containing protein [Bacteroidales bacterium]